jgi:hypothetical protein
LTAAGVIFSTAPPPCCQPRLHSEQTVTATLYGAAPSFAPGSHEAVSVPRGLESVSAPRGSESVSAPRGSESVSVRRGSEAVSVPRGPEDASLSVREPDRYTRHTASSAASSSSRSPRSFSSACSAVCRPRSEPACWSRSPEASHAFLPDPAPTWAHRASTRADCRTAWHAAFPFVVAKPRWCEDED